MRIFVIMTQLLKKHVALVLLSLLAGLCTIVSSIGLLSASSVLISRAALHPNVLDLMVLIVAVRFFGISRGVFRYLERILSHDATLRVLSSLRRVFFRSFNENYSENGKQYKTGDIYTKIVNDVDTLKEFYLRGVYPLIIAVLTGIITTFFISCYSKVLSIVYLLIYIVCGFFLPVFLFKINAGLIKRESELKGKMNLKLLDILNGILEVSFYSLKDKIYRDFKTLSEELSKVQREKNLISTIGDNIHGFFSALLMGLALIICAPFVNGNVIAGIYYAMLPLAISASFEALIPMPIILYKFHEAYNLGRNILSIVKDSDKDHLLDKANPDSFDISVENLCVYDEEEKKYLIKNISFKLPYGKKIAIVGLSGSGKTTVLNSLMCFIKFQSGDIKIEDVSYSKLNIDEIRKLFSIVDQNPYSFRTTIRENLLIANPQLESSEMMQSLREAKVDKLINELPEGLNTVLGHFGHNISGGEKQRIAIARALLKDSRILLYDEPTASIDVRLEREIMDSIYNAARDKSLVIVTHRLIEMNRMDEILVMDRGEIRERGSHEELIERRGLYYRLWSVQQQIIDNCRS